MITQVGEKINPVQVETGLCPDSYGYFFLLVRQAQLIGYCLPTEYFLTQVGYQGQIIAPFTPTFSFC